MNNILPESLQQPHIIAFDLLAKKRFNAIELDTLLVYMIDSVPESVLRTLAIQFDLMGYNGWKLADTTEKKRDLIKRGIELHRYKGTLWAIKEALRTVGFADATITEHVNHWAGFTIELGIGQNAVDPQRIEDALTMVKAYKNERSHLMGFEFKLDFQEMLSLVDDSYEAPGIESEDAVFLGGDFIYDGTYTYNGEKNYNNDNDVLEIIIS